MPAPRPEDRILDRYMPGASSEEREEARENLRCLVAFIIRVNERALSQSTDGIRAVGACALDSESPPPHV